MACKAVDLDHKDVRATCEMGLGLFKLSQSYTEIKRIADLRNTNLYY